MTRLYETAIVGAGPYGLSVAAHLGANGIPYRIFGRSMESWRQNMPTDMMLRSEAFASNLWDPERRYTLDSFCNADGLPYRPSGIPVPLSRFLDYAEWFQSKTVPIVQNLQLVKLARKLGGFGLDFSNGATVLTRNVVIAIGQLPFRNMPPALAGLPKELVSHSSDHCSLGHFVGKDAIVVGAGQSALETAALLHEQGARVRILARRDQIIWNRPPQDGRSFLRPLLFPEACLGAGWLSLAISELPQAFSVLPRLKRSKIVAKSWGPSGAWWLRDRVVDKVKVLTSHEITSATEHNGKMRLLVRAGTKMIEMEADHVIAATGFKRDVARLPFLDADLQSSIEAFEGAPTLSRAFESSVPGLFFVGHLAAPSFGPVMGFVFGAKHVAPVLTRRLGAEFHYRRPVSMHMPIEGNWSARI